MKYNELLNNSDSLLCKVFDKHFYEAREMIEKGADVNEATEEGITPLMIAASNGDLRMVHLICNHYVNINAVNNKGESALDYAFRAKRYEKGEIFYCQDPSVLENSYQTYKMGSWTFAYPSVIKFLISQGALTGKEIKDFDEYEDEEDEFVQDEEIDIN